MCCLYFVMLAIFAVATLVVGLKVALIGFACAALVALLFD